MKVVTAEEMRNIDRVTIEEYGIPGIVLMERAGLAVATKIKDLFGRKRIIVISGGGNNGGDGLVVARVLHNERCDVKVFLTARPEDLKGDALFQYNTAIKFGVEIHPFEEFLTHHSSLVTHHTIIVDALLGTGLSKNVAGKLSGVISLVNRLNIPVVSVDIPSGISSDNGQIMGAAIKANYTVTFGLPKRGHLLYPGADYTGRLFIEDIGFPQKLLLSDKLNVELLEKKNILSLIPERQRYSHKGDYGHVLIVSGSRGKTGAALMAAKACLRTGAGLVTLGIPESLIDIFQSRVTEEMTLPLPDKGDGTLSEKASGIILDFLNAKADVLAIGPGIGVSVETEKLIKTLIKNSKNPMVIDADGINALSGSRVKGHVARDILRISKSPIILTPHPGEMARLIQKAAPPPSPPPRGGRVREGVKAPLSEHQTQKAKNTVSEKLTANRYSLIANIEKDRINTAISFAKETGTYLVLKGVPTIIAELDGKAFINSTGNPGMATGGTGDVLTGMISGFLGQGLKPIDASITGVYMHGLAGDIAVAEKGEHSLIAGDIIDKIPAAFDSLYG
ncbi:MAG: NAD(P)H-hydrate epimerase [Nitrospira sp.]|nr:NAD(P)H-hydrate epimerase [Nitrospira sp.]